MTTNKQSVEQALTEHLHRALVNDGWQGHPDPLTDDDVLAIAETAARAALSLPSETEDSQR